MGTEDGPARYEIRVRGGLGPGWAAWFDGLSVTAAPDGTTLLCGDLVDQAALFGVLGRIRDLGLPLVSVTTECRVGPDILPPAI